MLPQSRATILCHLLAATSEVSRGGLSCLRIALPATIQAATERHSVGLPLNGARLEKNRHHRQTPRVECAQVLEMKFRSWESNEMSIYILYNLHIRRRPVPIQEDWWQCNRLLWQACSVCDKILSVIERPTWILLVPLCTHTHNTEGSR